MLPSQQPKTWPIMAAGASAGLIVDTVLFPVDTLKSRLQSAQGFSRAGGFSRLYRGLLPVVSGSIPNAAAFFFTYETVKDRLHHYKALGPRGNAHILTHMIAASLAEVTSCTIRVPYEVVKTRSQTSTAVNITKEILAKEGLAGFYRGFNSTLIRDLPFSAIQFPIWERLKVNHHRRTGKLATASESAYYGSIAGAIAAFVTTPLDVAKTRIMLADQSESLASGKVMAALRAVRAEKGIRGLFAGVVPRVLWISAGAAIFLGSYERALKLFGAH